MAALISRPVRPWVAGIVIGVIAVLAGTVGGINPPDAYGLCSTCHGRDLVLGILQPTWPGVSDFPTIWPALTTVGIVLGAWAARRVARERVAVETIDRRMVLTRLLQGFTAMSFALLAMGCPIRLSVRAADLAVEGAIGLAGVAAGVWIGVRYLRARA